MSVYPPPLNRTPIFNANSYLYTEKPLTVGNGIDLFSFNSSGNAIPGAFTTLTTTSNASVGGNETVIGNVSINGSITGSGGMTVNGTSVINSSGSGNTSIGSGSNIGLVTIGNSYSGTNIIGDVGVSGFSSLGGVNCSLIGVDGAVTCQNLTSSGSVNINTSSSPTPTYLGTGGLGSVNIGNANGGTIITGPVSVTSNGAFLVNKNSTVSVTTSATTVLTLQSGFAGSNLITVYNSTDQTSSLYLVTTSTSSIITITQLDTLTTFVSSFSSLNFKLQVVSGSKSVYTSYIRI